MECNIGPTHSIGTFDLRYPTGQVVGVGLVTMGVVWATLDNVNMPAKGVNIFFFLLFLFCFIFAHHGFS